MSTIIILPSWGWSYKDLEFFISRIKSYKIFSTKLTSYSIEGAKVICDGMLSDLINLTPKFLILIADQGFVELWDNTILREFLIAANENLIKMIAISLAPLVLAKFGILKDRFATVNLDIFPEAEKIMKKYRVKLVDLKWVKDNNIITAKRANYLPSDVLEEFSL